MLSVDIEKTLGDFHLNVSIEAEAGVTGILGASGCGKSMTLRCIAGIDTPDMGRIVFNGETLFDSAKRINLPPQRRRVGYLFQNYALFPNMTVEKNILCGLYHEKDAQKRKRAIGEAAELLRLGGLLQHKPIQLSGGQQQRAALARIIVNKPLLLMLDEPFSALDTHFRELLQIEMKALLEQYSGSVLMVTHCREEAYRLCSHIAVMSAGRILVNKPAKTLFADPESVTAAEISGCKNIAAAVKTGEYEVEAPGWGVRLATAAPVRDELCAVGLHGHYFDPNAAHNRFPVRIYDSMEEPFEWVIRFKYENQREDAPALWWRLSKDRKPQNMPEILGISPSNIQLLYPEK